VPTVCFLHYAQLGKRKRAALPPFRVSLSASALSSCFPGSQGLQGGCCYLLQISTSGFVALVSQQNSWRSERGGKTKEKTQTTTSSILQNPKCSFFYFVHPPKPGVKIRHQGLAISTSATEAGISAPVTTLSKSCRRNGELTTPLPREIPSAPSCDFGQRCQRCISLSSPIFTFKHSYCHLPVNSVPKGASQMP